MSKLILTGLCAATLGLAACGYDEEQNYDANAAYNAEEANYADNAVDYNDSNAVDYNDSGNATGNASDNAMDNAAGNTAGNTY